MRGRSARTSPSTSAAFRRSPSCTIQRPHGRALRTTRHQGVNDPFRELGRSGDDTGVVHALVYVNAVPRRVLTGRHRTPPRLSCSVSAQIAAGRMRCQEGQVDRHGVAANEERVRRTS
jgi:hypothetical protein